MTQRSDAALPSARRDEAALRKKSRGAISLDDAVHVDPRLAEGGTC